MNTKLDFVCDIIVGRSVNGSTEPDRRASCDANWVRRLDRGACALRCRMLRAQYTSRSQRDPPCAPFITHRARSTSKRIYRNIRINTLTNGFYSKYKWQKQCCVGFSAGTTVETVFNSCLLILLLSASDRSIIVLIPIVLIKCQPTFEGLVQCGSINWSAWLINWTASFLFILVTRSYCSVI